MNTSPSTPKHIAIVMDGNGRWAEERKRPRSMGHQAGLKSLRKTVENCVQRQINILTVFAFSSENWNRPQGEVSRLMELFMRALDKEVKGLHENGVRVCFIGDRSAFATELRSKMDKAEALTTNNNKLILNVAANYGGRWDIVHAMQRLAPQLQDGSLSAEDITEQTISDHTALSWQDEPDLLIRTGGEMRISNFLLWQIAYTELFFTPVLWPDFDEQTLDTAIQAFQSRERRFGQTGKQIRDKASA